MVADDCVLPVSTSCVVEEVWSCAEDGVESLRSKEGWEDKMMGEVGEKAWGFV